MAQAFTTGARPGGYAVTAVDVRSVDPQGDAFSLDVCTVDASGNPTTTCWAFTPPSSFAAGLLTFEASGSVTLAASTTYAVVLTPEGSSLTVSGEPLRLGLTTSSNEDSGKRAGWSIANAARFVSTHTSQWAQDQQGYIRRIAIKGNFHAPLRATLELAGEDEGYGGLIDYLVDLKLSDSIWIPSADMRDHAFTVTGGTIKRAKRHTRVRRYIGGVRRALSTHWRLTVRSAEATGATVLSLPDFRACSVRGALCTRAGGELEIGPEITLGEGENTAKVGLSVADATASEGGFLTFTVTASRPLKRNMFGEVSISDDEGTATSGDDYGDWGSGTVQMVAGETTTSFRVFANTDSVTDDDETVVVELTGAWIIKDLDYNTGDYIKGRKVPISDGKATGTISDVPGGSGVGDRQLMGGHDRPVVSGDGPPVIVRGAVGVPGTGSREANGTETPANDRAGDDQRTARLHTAEAEHGGAGQPFTVGLTLGGEVSNVGEAWVRDRLVAATNGAVTQAVRAVESPPGNREWTLTVEPRSALDVAVYLTEGMTLADGRELYVGPPVTVPGPAARSASVDGTVLTLVWPAARDGFGTPAGSDWYVSVNGVPRAVATAEIAGRRAVLQLSAPAVTAADAVTVGYVGSAMHPLADATGTLRSAPWDGFAAHNVTGAGASPPAVDAPPTPAAERLGTAPPDGARLDASGLDLADLAALAPFASLERLDFSGNALADLSGIEAHAGLRELDLSGNRIADLAPLRALHALERLDLSRNRVTDVAALAGLPALEVLVLDGNAVADLGPLTHFARLEHLSLAGNRVADVTPLQDLPRLRRLDLGGNPAQDLSPLGDVAALEWLALPGDSAAAEDALARLTGLRWIWRAPTDGRGLRR